ILNMMDQEKVAGFLTLLDERNARGIKTLLHYEEQTAGSIMTTEMVALYKSQNVRQTMKQWKEEAPDAKNIYYLYVIDENKRIGCVHTLRDFIVADVNTLIGEIMSENVMSVSVGKNQIEVAQMMRDYDFLAAPVVDFQHHLIGIITVDDILDV